MTAPNETANRRPGGIREVVREAARWGELRRTQYGLAPAVVLGTIFFFELLDTQAFSLAGPDIARSLGIAIGQIIGVLVLVGVVLTFVSLGVGWWADRHARVPLVGIGAAISGVFSFLTGAVHSSLALGGARSGDDGTDLASGIPRFSLLADYYPPEVRGRAFSLLGAMQNSARLVAPVVIGILVTQAGWRTTFFVAGPPIAVVGLISLFILREPIRGYQERRALGMDDEAAREEDEPQSFGEAWRTIWAVRTLRRVFIADIFDSVQEVFAFFFVFFLAERYGLDALQRGLVFLPAVAAGLVGNFIGGGLIDRFTRRNPGRVLTLRAVISAVAALGVAGIALAPPLWTIVALEALVSFGLFLVRPANSVVYSQVIPASVRTQGLQVFNLATLPTTIVFFPVAGLINAKYGYGAVFLSVAPMLLVGSAIAASAGGFFGFDMRNAFAAAAASDEWRRTRAAGRGKLLVCRDVDVEYDGVQVLFGVDFDIAAGEIVALLGTNGAGKSTLLRAISGTQEASSGAIVFDGRDITHMPPHEITARGVVHMPGGRGVFPDLTVAENLLLSTWLIEDEAEARARVDEALELFPALRERADSTAAVLSGGQQQMLSLAQAFVTRPRLLMIDELSLGLSPAVVAQLLDAVRTIHAQGTTVVVVEQSVNVALTLADRAIFMEKGTVRFVGPTTDLLARPDVVRAVYVRGSQALTGGTPGAVPGRAGTNVDANPAVIEVDGLRKRFGGVVALDDVTLSLREGEVLGLIGPNGSGKTTLFDVISGFEQPDAGRVMFDGIDVTALPAEERARRKLVRRFQAAQLFGSLTVLETLLVALEQRIEVRNVALYAVALPTARRAERRARAAADRLLELLDLGAYRDKFVRELSTGLRRIVDLACVLAVEPRVLLLDEPSSGIAQAESEALGPLLGRVKYETGCSLMIIEHDMPLLSSVADELVALDRGSVVTRGTPDAVLDDERVVASYLGGSEDTIRRSGSLA